MIENIFDLIFYILYLCVVQQEEKPYGAEDCDMDESEELLQGSRRQYVVKFPLLAC